MQIIGVAGQLANGKDVLAAKLCALLNGRYAHSAGHKWGCGAWADGLKQAFYDSFGISKEMAEIWKRKENTPSGFNITVRKAYQIIGQTFRDIKDDVWINWTINKSDNGTILTDTRHADELKKISSCRGINVLVHRPGYLNDSDHPSELQMRDIVQYFLFNDQFDGEIDKNTIKQDKHAPAGADCIDYFIMNDSGMESFKAKVAGDFLDFVVDKFKLKGPRGRIKEPDSRRIFVPKGWGYEDWIVNNEKYCGKELFFKKGRRCSMHYHKLKEETFFVSQGKLLIVVSNDERCVKEINGKKELRIKIDYETDQLMDLQQEMANIDWEFYHGGDDLAKYSIMNPGDHFHVPVGLIHAMYGLQDTKMFEFSTQHLDSDSIRLLRGD